MSRLTDMLGSFFGVILERQTYCNVNYIFSCTKSFLSALIGVALDQCLIPTIDQPIVEHFPELPRLNPGPRFHAMTIRHLLSMTSGID